MKQLQADSLEEAKQHRSLTPEEFQNQVNILDPDKVDGLIMLFYTDHVSAPVSDIDPQFKGFCATWFGHLFIFDSDAGTQQQQLVFPYYNLKYGLSEQRSVVQERKIQNHSDLGPLVINSRTVVFYGWDFLLLSLPYVVVKLEQYRPEYLSLDVRNKRLFVTFRARSDAVRLFSDKRFKILTLPDKINIKFASNYPRARCSSDFGLTGVYRVHPSEMDNNLRSYSAREIGSAFLKAHFNQVAAWLTRKI
ncbi:hypothetical protein MP228_010579 [Amoeboaphelidium protococcarum]|nr:hypothetical protein MP228_010579 [Amoeboaphelidium protococcarum]